MTLEQDRSGHSGTGGDRRAVSRNAAALSASVLLLLLTIHFGEPSATGLWYRTFFDALHVPVFGAIAVCLFILSGLGHDRTLRNRLGITTALVVILSGLSEAAQIPGPRDASLGDLASDWLGAGGFLLLAMAFSEPSIHRRGRLAGGLAGAALLFAALLPLLTVSAAYLNRDWQRPTLIDFKSRFSDVFVRAQNATIEAGIFDGNGSRAAHVVLGPGPWPGIIAKDIWPDWTGYETLVIEARSATGTPLTLNLRIHDYTHETGDQPYSDRYNTTIRLQNDMRSIRIPLAQVSAAPARRRLNMKEIAGIAVFGTARDAGKEFYLSAIRLE